MLQAHYDHSSIFLLDMFGEEYIVQYLNSNWTEALLSFLHFLNYCFLFVIVYFIAAKCLCKYRKLTF